MAVHVAPQDVDDIMLVMPHDVRAAVIGEITDDDKEVFTYEGETVAVIPNRPSLAVLAEVAREE